MIVATTRSELRRALEDARNADHKVGLVPTMGYLHQGHLSLVDLARGSADFLATSIFVNPLQFGEGEDLDRYPRDMEKDLALLEDRSVDLVFHPSVAEMYPDGDPGVTVDPGPLGSRLCGAYRPGHFRGVLTVVARLFGLFRPDVAAFGRKDFQQAVLIRRMVRDLELGVQILVGEIIREEDGLAMSSRNVFLSSRERESARGIRRSLLAVQEAFRGGEASGRALLDGFHKKIGSEDGLKLQYAQIVDPNSLEPVELVEPRNVLAVAAFAGRTRLIDNQPLGG